MLPAGPYLHRAQRKDHPLFGLVLGFTGSEGLGQRTPKPIQARIEHFDEAAHVFRLGGVQEQLGLFGIAVTASLIALQEPDGNQRVKEIPRGAFVQTKPFAQFGQRERPFCEGPKHLQFNCAQECLRRPESGRKLHDPVVGNPLCHFGPLSNIEPA
jgi:hypothetical protein